MKLLITTRCDKNITGMTAYTFPFLEAYADKCGADFMKLDKDPIVWTNENPPRPHYRIMEHYRLFDDYDRILSVDSDVLIQPNCPNVFELVPEDRIGTVFEDVGTRMEHRRALMIAIQQKFGDVGWRNGYINTGFFLSSRQHREMFTPIRRDMRDHYWMDFGYDDVHLGYKLNGNGYEVFELPYIYNHMTMFSEAWNNYANRFDSYVIHYAGNGIFEKKYGSRNEQIRADSIHIRGEDL